MTELLESGIVPEWTLGWRLQRARHLHACGFQESLHALRHRFATQTYQSSRDLRLVQELLGHASPSTTAGYAAYDRAGAADAVAALATPRRLRSVK